MQAGSGVNNSLFSITPARRSQVKLMIGLTGPSGSGKTYSALQLAYGITGDWAKVYVADTENKSSLYYAGEKTGDWNHIDFPPTLRGGYNPENWMALIDTVEAIPSAQVLILDSISHAWNAKGGVLDVVEASAFKGNTYAGWKVGTPLQNAFLDKMRGSRLHIIATMRSVQDYHVEKNDRGKSAPIKVGLKPVQREGIEYEFGIIFDINMEHYALSSKDRTGLFSHRGGFKITEEIGKELLDWANQGDTVVYEAKPDQKLMLVKILRGMGIPDDKMKGISDQLLNTSMTELQMKISEILTAQEHNLEEEPVA